ncbi:MAG: trypsin-like peptidase domain-containing protein [Candidatus Obscuribacterales bacterium]|nr:trypsin-like peptidase domain-containing protein [Candidatus Obscuribacterales bacterium]
MANDVDDDVPIYFSPGEEMSEEDILAMEPDRSALLKDDAPPAWERYRPAKTLEQASKEAEVAGEKKIKGLRNRPGEKSIPPPDRSKDDSIKNSQESTTPEAKVDEQSNTLERFLKLSGRFLKPNVVAVEPETVIPADSAGRIDGPREEPPASRKQVKAMFFLACVNVFAIGFWCGSFLFPHNHVVTGLREDDSSDTPPPGIAKVRRDLAVADVVAKINPTVVNIDTRFRRVPEPVAAPFQSTQKFFQPPPNARPTPRSYPGQSQGSGLIVSTTGHILTNNHVVAPGAEIRVTLADHREYQGAVVARDAYSDLAIVKISANNLPVAHFADARRVRVGDWAIVIGSPHGFDHTVTIGVVSALNRVIPDFNHHIPLIQTDASIAPGNSGGPVVNLDGEVIGIAVAAANRGVLGINFALPSDTVSQVARKLIEEGGIPRPFLGIYMEDIDPDRKKAHTLPGHPVMVLVKAVVNQGPAAKVGIRPGDIIMRVNKKSVTSSDEVRDILATLKPGDEMNFDLRRLEPAGETSKKVILEKYPDNY